jgi:hypothetical protein
LGVGLSLTGEKRIRQSPVDGEAKSQNEKMKEWCQLRNLFMRSRVLWIKSMPEGKV